MDLSGRTLGEFRLRELIGEGGYGALYRAEQPALKREVVVKVLREERDSHDARERFLREARLAAQLRHPYAAQVYSFGSEDDGRLLWIAMELVDGITLADWLATHGALSLRELVPFFDHLAEVVDAMHQCGIVHRDLKPSNVMVVESKQGVLVPKLLDFGIAKAPVAEDPAPTAASAADHVVTTLIRAKPAPRHREPTKTRRRPVNARQRGLTRTGAGFGSRLYMSPEQWGNASGVGPAADIYSLGIMLYEALTGRVPFPSINTDDLIRQHCYEPMPPLGSEFSPELDRVLSRALAKSPKNRHTNALELAAELRAVLHADPHEQIRALAQRWKERGRSPDLLARGQVLADLVRIAHHPRDTTSLGDLECSFVAESQRRIRRIRWAQRALVALGALVIVGGLLYRAATKARQATLQTELAQKQTQLAQEQARSAKEVTEATVTQAELEQGRAALLHGEMTEAQRHLDEAWRRGDQSPSTAFMYARALQPLRAELARLPALKGRMWSASWSPDGRLIATTDDAGAQIWSAETYEPLALLPHRDAVYSAAWAPDGRLVTACGDGSVRIWSAGTGDAVRELRLRGDRALRWYVVAVTPDGRRVAAVDAKGAIAAVWDAGTGVELTEASLAGAGWPTIAFSANGRWLAASGGGPVEVLDVATWRRAAELGEQVRAIAWDPTGPRLLAGSAVGDASIWSLPSAAREAPHELGEAVTAVAFSPDGRRSAIGGEDGTEQVFDTSGRIVSQGNYLRARIASIAFDAAGARVVAAGASGELAIGDAASGLPVEVLQGPQQQLRGAWFGPSGRRVLAASADGTARVWNASSPYRRWGAGPLAGTYGLFGGAEPDGRYLAIVCPGCATRVWDTAHDRLLAELPPVAAPNPDAPIPFPAVSAGGDRAAIAAGTTAVVYELPGGRLLQTVRHNAEVTALAFTPAGELVSGDAAGAVLVGDVEQLRGPAGIDAIAMLPGDRIAAADARGSVRIVVGGSGEFSAGIRARMLRPSGDGQRVLVVAYYSGSPEPMVLVDLDARAMVRLESSPAYTARWVDGGRAILSTHADGAARLWSANGVLRRTYAGAARFLAEADLSPDGTMVVGGGGDGMLRFWDAVTGQPLWVVAAHRPYVMGLHFEAGDLVTRGIGGEVSRWSLPPADAVIRGGTAPAR